MANNTHTTRSSPTHKMLTWCLAAISSLASFFAIQNNNRLQESREIREQVTAYYQKQIELREIIITRERKEKDSLQGLILLRADHSYDELKQMLSIERGGSTITIKPKEK